MANVKVYSTPTCPFCRIAKDYLKSKGVDFDDINVAENEQAAKEMVNLTGQTGVPVIRIKNKVIVGFSRKAIDDALSRNN